MLITRLSWCEKSFKRTYIFKGYNGVRETSNNVTLDEAGMVQIDLLPSNCNRKNRHMQLLVVQIGYLSKARLMDKLILNFAK